MSYRLIQDIERIRRNHKTLLKSEAEHIKRVKGFIPNITITTTISNKAKDNIKELIDKGYSLEDIKNVYTKRLIGHDFLLGRNESIESVESAIALSKEKVSIIDFTNIEPF